jgi:hypothetical protein
MIPLILSYVYAPDRSPRAPNHSPRPYRWMALAEYCAKRAPAPTSSGAGIKRWNVRENVRGRGSLSRQPNDRAAARHAEPEQLSRHCQPIPATEAFYRNEARLFRRVEKAVSTPSLGAGWPLVSPRARSSYIVGRRKRCLPFVSPSSGQRLGRKARAANLAALAMPPYRSERQRTLIAFGSCLEQGAGAHCIDHHCPRSPSVYDRVYHHSPRRPFLPYIAVT